MLTVDISVHYTDTSERGRSVARGLLQSISMIMRRVEAGYTLLEMMTVLVMMAVLAAFAFVRFGPALAHSNVRAAANVLASDLQYAQMLAVRERKPIIVSVDASAMQYTITDRSGTVYRTRTFGPTSDFKIDEITAVPASVQLFPSGVADATATIVLGQGGYQRQVSVTRAGQVRVGDAP